MSCNMIMKKLLSVFQTITKRERGLRLIMMNCNKANVLMSVALCSRKSGWPARKREEKEMIGQSAAASPAGAGSVQAVRTQDTYMPEQYHLQSFLWSWTRHFLCFRSFLFFIYLLLFSLLEYHLICFFSLASILKYRLVRLFLKKGFRSVKFYRFLQISLLRWLYRAT